MALSQFDKLPELNQINIEILYKSDIAAMIDVRNTY